MTKEQIIATCEAWIAEGRGDECFWEVFPDQPTAEGFTPTELLAVLRET